jgi:hypothetical protein
MAGPTFCIRYGEFTPEMCERLATMLARISKPFYRRAIGDRARGRLFEAELYVESRHLRGSGYRETSTGTIGVTVHRHRKAYRDGFVDAAFQASLGLVPRVELAGYCMAKGYEDWDALRLIAEQVADAFGGWVIEHVFGIEIPSLPMGLTLLDPGVVEVVARDATGMREERYWAFDARRSASAFVRK